MRRYIAVCLAALLGVSSPVSISKSNSVEAAVISQTIAAPQVAIASQKAAKPMLEQVRENELAKGVVYKHYKLPGSTAGVYVAQMENNGPASLKVVSANNAVGGGRETVSSMCDRTTGCIAAVNGDYWYLDTKIAAPRGAVVSHGELWKTDQEEGNQLRLNPRGRGLPWSGEVTAGGLELELAGVNVPVVKNKVVLYTHRYDRPTGGRGLKVLRAKAGPNLGKLGATTKLSEMRIVRPGKTVKRGSAQLVACGKSAALLKQLAAQRNGRLQLSVSKPVADSIGFYPSLLLNGQEDTRGHRWQSLSRKNPRTILAWNDQYTWLIAADGRQPHGAGLTAKKAGLLALWLGATDAVLLDGGGSTTFYAKHRLRNKPSDGHQRGVVNALVIVMRRSMFR